MLILLSPWPENYGLVWLTLVLVVVFECIRSQRNIMSCRGELVLMSDNSIQWHREVDLHPQSLYAQGRCGAQPAQSGRQTAPAVMVGGGQHGRPGISPPAPAAGAPGRVLA